VSATGKARAELIYGHDTRRDAFAVDDVWLRDTALATSVALVPAGALESQADGSFAISAPSSGEFYNLCLAERFREQPAAAVCSGVLVGESLVLTAGHCAHRLACGEQAWVFGYAITEDGRAPRLFADDVYHCDRVALAAHHVDAAGRRWDYAAVQLSRPVVAPRKPLAVSRELPREGDRVNVVGYPAGVPLKVDGPAAVLSVRPDTLDYFMLNSDTYDRSSGSAVLAENGELVGLLVRGGQDYEYREREACWVSRRVPEAVPAEDAEHASYAASVVGALCAQGISLGEPCEGLRARGGGCALAMRPCDASVAMCIFACAIAASTLRRRSRNHDERARDRTLVSRRSS
jgi:V8-like Glu-specific endopeptidase